MRHQNQNRMAHLTNMSPLLAAAGFNSAPCCLSLRTDSSLYSITQIIREARTLAYNGRQVPFINVGHFILSGLPSVTLPYHSNIILSSVTSSFYRLSNYVYAVGCCSNNFFFSNFYSSWFRDHDTHA
jgi:hypothetical protein